MMHFLNNNEDRKEYYEYYKKSYDYYKSENMSIKEIELEISRLESRIHNYSNPGIPAVVSFIILIISLYSNISGTNILSFWFNIIIIIVFIGVYLFMGFTNKITINTSQYNASIKALSDLKNERISNKSYRRSFI